MPWLSTSKHGRNLIISISKPNTYLFSDQEKETLEALCSIKFDKNIDRAIIDLSNYRSMSSRSFEYFFTFMQQYFENNPRMIKRSMGVISTDENLINMLQMTALFDCITLFKSISHATSHIFTGH